MNFIILLQQIIYLRAISKIFTKLLHKVQSFNVLFRIIVKINKNI